MGKRVANNRTNGETVKPPFYLLASFTIYIIGISAFSNSSSFIFRSCAAIYGVCSALYLSRRGLILKINHYIMASLVFFAWLSASGVWQYSRLLYSSRLGTVGLIILFSMLTIQWANNGRYTLIQVLKCVVYANLFTIVYKFANGEINLRMTFSQNARSILGANDLAIIFVLSTCISIYLALEIDKRYFVFSILFASVSLMTGSRKAISGLLILILFYAVIRSKDLKKFVKSLLATGVVFFIIYFAITHLSAFSYLNERLKLFINYSLGTARDYSTQNREMFRRLGWSSFFLNPIIGYGVSYSTTNLVGVYLHDNYVELAVSLGAIGLFLFYLRHFLIIRIGLKISRIHINEKSLILSALFLCLLLDYGAVTYFDKFVWMFITLVYEIGMQTLVDERKEVFVLQ